MSVALVLALAVLATIVVSAAIVRLLPTLQLQLGALALLIVCLPRSEEHTSELQSP